MSQGNRATTTRCWRAKTKDTNGGRLAHCLIDKARRAARSSRLIPRPREQLGGEQARPSGRTSQAAGARVRSASLPTAPRVRPDRRQRTEEDKQRARGPANFDLSALRGVPFGVFSPDATAVAVTRAGPGVTRQGRASQTDPPRRLRDRSSLPRSSLLARRRCFRAAWRLVTRPPLQHHRRHPLYRRRAGSRSLGLTRPPPRQVFRDSSRRRLPSQIPRSVVRGKERQREKKKEK